MYTIFVLAVSGTLYNHPPTDLATCQEKVETLHGESLIYHGACIGDGDYYYFDTETGGWEYTVFIDHTT